MNKVAIALGGNVGKVKDTFNEAILLLMKAGLKDIKISPILINPAVGCIEGTPDFENAAITGNWGKSALELLEACQRIELTLGRPQEHKSNMSRTIDLDIILFGNMIIDTKELKIPHPRAENRTFVLNPLSKIAPNWEFLNTRKTVKKSLEQLVNK
ncbi:MAG TPA: 2-amino-4-hydroxy-6-hydroxymethyldihydropteridine diphosphokinase [Lentisphaeria bacterium]|nr:MAG: 2-amino-4-hydroxy-6-hydroxymethyldihydropteridine diphosphokinase [Lentisphaerae bacterium GWF2_38_69]HBM15841.1 2-amino-4-hydroxy-6-hydroxymethyldihydropteridine diphosphokinase [Lentisphaeria bacterium]